MAKRSSWLGLPRVSLVAAAGMVAVSFFGYSYAQQIERPAFVIVERVATTGDESIQDEYARLAREILPKYGGHYLARSRVNTLLEGDEPTPCCVALLQFPSLEAVKRWYDSAENRSAAASAAAICATLRPDAIRDAAH
jgi:uncharacterized protein (DUF1330 family)